jgi:hypothetical protein
MVFDRQAADAEDQADFFVAFALAHPVQDFRLARADRPRQRADRACACWRLMRCKLMCRYGSSSSRK